jgi:hypothetical protein
MLLGLAALLFSGRTPPPAAPSTPAKSETRAKIEESIRRACAFLESRRADFFIPLADGKRHLEPPVRTYAELGALALIRAGYPASHSLVDELIGRALGRPLESTYVASLRAQLLSELGGRTDRLRQCAQFLVDSQCANGQWDYGSALKGVDAPADGLIRATRTGPPSGDNSVSAYAIQGLLVCKRAGIEVDADVLRRARRCWLSCQNADGGWGYRDALQPNNVSPMLTSDTSYGSTTASGVAALAALREMLGDDPDAARALERGLAWLGENFSADVNPKKAAGFSYLHWLAGASRAADLTNLGAFGAHDWYAEGARFLLSRQQPTGEWRIEGDFMKSERNEIVDTCLAILFLTRKG